MGLGFEEYFLFLSGNNNGTTEEGNNFFVTVHEFLFSFLKILLEMRCIENAALLLNMHFQVMLTNLSSEDTKTIAISILKRKNRSITYHTVLHSRLSSDEI